jgi:hypothetical protein
MDNLNERMDRSCTEKVSAGKPKILDGSFTYFDFSRKGILA